MRAKVISTLAPEPAAGVTCKSERREPARLPEVGGNPSARGISPLGAAVVGTVLAASRRERAAIAGKMIPAVSF